jgi:hypothetical protein
LAQRKKVKQVRVEFGQLAAAAALETSGWRQAGMLGLRKFQ